MPEMRQKLELRKLLLPELRQSLNILALPLIDLRMLVQQELNVNPFLEEVSASERPVTLSDHLPPARQKGAGEEEPSPLDFVAQPVSLYEVLLRQLSMFTDSDEDFRIGQEIIGNLDDNGYLALSADELAAGLKVPVREVERVLSVVQRFEPAGIAARGVAECLLLQLAARNELDPLIERLIRGHLDDIAKKRHSHIAKALNEPWERIAPLLKKIVSLDPKPARNFSASDNRCVSPDVTIHERNEHFDIQINNEDMPFLKLSDTYTRMLKDAALDPQTKAFLKEKQETARELLRAVSKRTFTLRRIIEFILENQREAVENDLSHLKPMTFEAAARQLDIHPSTVCRAVMNKYVRLPYGVVALKDFFVSHVSDQAGNQVASTKIKRLVSELIQAEDKRHPLSDLDISRKLLEGYQVKASRRTVTKYREEMKILSSPYRRER